MNEEPAIGMGGMAGSSDEVPHRRTDISALRLKLAQVRERIRSSVNVEEVCSHQTQSVSGWWPYR